MPTQFLLVRIARVTRVAVLGVGLIAALHGAASAQEATPQQQSQAQAVSFAGDGGVVFWQIKPDKTADFEHVMSKFKEALLKSEDATRKQMAAGLKVYKTAPWVAPGGQAPDPTQNVLYLLLLDPAVSGADYSSTAMLKILYEAFPSEGQDLYQKFVQSSAGGRNVLNLHNAVK